MNRQTGKILKYEIHSLVRSRWLLALGVLLLVVTETLFRFGGEAHKTIASLMNVVLIVVPLLSLILGTTYFYNSREYNQVLLAQPLNRTSIYLGRLIGFTGAVSLMLAAGLGIPFVIHSYDLQTYMWQLVTLLLVGVAFVVIFTSVAFYAATRFEDRIKGLAAAIGLWFFLTVMYDGLVLLFIHVFRDYPYESGLVALVALNPVDLGRILILLQLDAAALMGYTGAIFTRLFGTHLGTYLSAGSVVVYAGVPVLLGLASFKRKDF